MTKQQVDLFFEQMDAAPDLETAQQIRDLFYANWADASEKVRSYLTTRLKERSQSVIAKTNASERIAEARLNQLV
jgi:hypothetical protein